MTELPCIGLAIGNIRTGPDDAFALPVRPRALPQWVGMDAGRMRVDSSRRVYSDKEMYNFCRKGAFKIFG